MIKRRTAEETQDTMPAASDNVGATVETTPTIAAGIENAPQTIAAVKQEPPASQESAPPLGAEGKSYTRRESREEPQKSWVKKASIIVDPEAGVKFHFDYEKHQGIITFDEKPTVEQLAVVRPLLHGGDFEWDKVNRDGWKKKLQSGYWEDDRREAKKTFYAVANALREQKGLPARSFGEAMAF